MSKNPQEWLKQADYDMETAEIMFDNKGYFYAVFMCHLSISQGHGAPCPCIGIIGKENDI